MGGSWWPGSGLLAALRIPDSSREVSCEAICAGGDETCGVGGRGLFRSELALSRERGEDAGLVEKEGENSENDTVCGVLAVTNLPCLCLGGGGFCFGFLGSLTKWTRSSSSETGISYDVRGDSVCDS